MEDNEKCRDFLEDLIKEVNSTAMRETILEEISFERGYRAGIMAILKVFEDEIRAFNMQELGLNAKLIDVDEWFRLGRDYRPEK